MYYFLGHTLILGVIWLGLYLKRKDLRKEMLFASFLFFPFGLTHPLFIPDYYNPTLLYRFFGLFDVESFLWCFFIGGIVAVLYEEIFSYSLHKPGIKLKTSNSSKLSKYIIYLLLIFLAVGMVCAYAMELSALRASFVLVIPIILYMIAARHDLWRESVVSGFLITILYFLTLLSLEAFFPGYQEIAWTNAGLWGVRIAGFPLEEYCFAFLLGMMWSILYEEIQNLKIVRRITR